MSQVAEFPHTDKDTYIITRTTKPPVGKSRFYSGNLKELVMKLKRYQGKNIFVDGGAEIVNLLIKDNLINEFYISIIPVLLGSGVKLFREGMPETKLTLLESKQYATGLVQLHYKIVKI
jgi:dihydrofolate reductase